MSDIRFNRWLHQSGTGGVYQNGSGRVGIGSSAPTEILDVVGNITSSGDITATTATFSGNVSVGGVLIYDDVTNIDSVGVITARAGVIVSSGSSIGIGTDDAKFTLDVRGETSFGEGMDNTNLGWNPNAYQRVYGFSGASGGNVNSPADAALLLANPNTNPSNTRVGALVFGNSVVGTSNTSTNPGLKGSIECYTNTNISTNPDDTGSRINILTKRDGYNLQTVATFDSEGRITKPLQPSFHATNTTIGQINTDGYGVIIWNDVTNYGNHNVGGHYNTSNGRFTAPIAGRYLICARSLTNSSANGNPYVTIFVRLNGTNMAYVAHNHTDSWLMESYSGILNLSAGDYVDVYVGQASAHGAQNYSSFSGHLLS
jgi:hypothetical protein